MHPRLFDGLLRLARALQSRDVPFQLGGSGLLYALGLHDRVEDLDLVLPAAAREDLERAVGGWWRDSSHRPEGPFRSRWVARLDVDGVPAEAIGGLGLLIEGRPVEVPFRPGPDWELEGVTVPLAPPEQWYVVYRLHDPQKARLVAGALTETELRRGIEELGLTAPPGPG